MANNICSLFPQLKKDPSGKLEDSQLFTDLLAHTERDRSATTKLYASTKTDAFKVWSGDWVSARKDWLNHKFPTLEEAQTHYNVAIETDSKGEPLLKNGQFTKNDGTTLDPSVDGKLRKNTINNYLRNNLGDQSSKKLLQLHKEAKNELDKAKREIDKIKEEKQHYIKYLTDNGLYNASDSKLLEFSERIAKVVEDSKVYSDKLTDLEKGDILEDRDNYDGIAHLIMDRIETTPGYDLKKPEDIKALSNDYNLLKTISSINALHTEESILPLETSNRATLLKDKILDHVREYVQSLTPFVNLTGKDEDVLSLDMLNRVEKDVNSVEYWFNGFGDYPRLEAQLIHSRVLKGKSVARLNTGKKVNELLGHMNNLKDWAHNNIRGLNVKYITDSNKLKKAYNLLTEVNHSGKLDLVKPYNRFYYRDLNDAMQKRYSGDKGLEGEGKFWLKNNYHKIVGDNKVNPAYRNGKFEYIQKTKPLKDFYDFFKKEVDNGYKLLPPWLENKNSEKIPSMLTDKAFSFMDLASKVRDQGVARSMWEGVKTLLFGSGSLELYDKEGKIADRTKHEELSGDDIKLRMIGEISPDKKSTDLGRVLKDWISFTQDYHQMSEALPEVRMIQSIAGAKDYRNGNKIINGEDSTMYKAINRYIDAKILGNNSLTWGPLGFLGAKVYDEQGVPIGEQKYYFTDFVKKLIGYTRALNLGFNPFSAVNNIVMGYANDLREAAGNEYFSQGDIVRATKTYFGNRFNEESKFNLLADYIQPLQELGEYEDLTKVELPNLKKTLHDKMFIMQHYGEDFVQGITMIAYLNHEKVATKDGQKSLWDLFSVKDGKLVFDHATAGFRFDQNMLNQHRETIKKVNRTIHGNYSKDNSSVFEPYVGYQAAMLFKKWIPQSIASRFQGERYDYYSGKTLEGSYRTLAKVLSPKRVYAYATNTLKSLIGMEDRLKQIEPLKPHEIANMRKNICELGLVLSFTLTKKLMAPPPDQRDRWLPDWWENLSITHLFGVDDDSEFKNWNSAGAIGYKYMLYQVNQGLNDVNNFYDISITNPANGFYGQLVMRQPLINTVATLGKVATSLWTEAVNSDDYRKTHFVKGPEKGENKLLDNTLNAIPVVKQINRTRISANKSFKDMSQSNLGH